MALECSVHEQLRKLMEMFTSLCLSFAALIAQFITIAACGLSYASIAQTASPCQEATITSTQAVASCRSSSFNVPALLHCDSVVHNSLCCSRLS